VSKINTILLKLLSYIADALSAWGVPLICLLVISGYLYSIGDETILPILSALGALYFCVLAYRSRQRRDFDTFVKHLRDLDKDKEKEKIGTKCPAGSKLREDLVGISPDEDF